MAKRPEKETVPAGNGPLGPVYDRNGIFIAPAQSAIDPERPPGPWDNNRTK